MAEADEIGRCPACGKAIRSDHPYTWCSSCGDPLPEEIRSRLPSVRRMREEAAKAEESRGGPLVVEGREIACPICAHDQFWTRRTLMDTRGASFFGLEWAGQAAQNYICTRCGYVLWFLK